MNIVVYKIVPMSRTRSCRPIARAVVRTRCAQNRRSRPQRREAGRAAVGFPARRLALTAGAIRWRTRS